MERKEPSYTVGGNVNWYNHYGKQYGVSLHKANLDAGEGFRASGGALTRGHRGRTRGGTLWGRQRRAVTMTQTELLGPSPPQGSVSRWLR